MTSARTLTPHGPLSHQVPPSCLMSISGSWQSVSQAKYSSNERLWCSIYYLCSAYLCTTIQPNTNTLFGLLFRPNRMGIENLVQSYSKAGSMTARQASLGWSLDSTVGVLTLLIPADLDTVSRVSQDDRMLFLVEWCKKYISYFAHFGN